MALRDISDGEELVTNYAYPCGPDGRDCDDWYTVYKWVDAKSDEADGRYAKKLESRASRSTPRGGIAGGEL